jgi:hypothetical protein
MIRVRLSAEKGMVVVGEKGSRYMVTDSTTTPRVESKALNKIGRGVWADAFPGNGLGA